jgi:uncharacterized protein (TIGR03000 family)
MWVRVFYCYPHGSEAKWDDPEHDAPPDKQMSAAPSAQSATIVVNLPADAKLTFDDQPTVSTSARRVFVTPALENGKDCYYTLKGEVIRNGQVRFFTQKVIVRAGQETQVKLEELSAAVAAR